jgi:aerobic C4-dicarboxylate transport protein
MVKKKIWTSLYFQVLAGIFLGILLGILFPEAGVAVKPFGDAFIKLIKMLIAPIIFGTIVAGFAHMGDMRKVGRVGLKALIYFEIMTTLALILGLLVVDILQPGAGMGVDPSQLDASSVEAYARSGQSQGAVDFLLGIIPQTAFSGFVQGNILQVLLISCLFGTALLQLGEKGQTVLNLVDQFTRVFFGIIAMVMRLAPLGAFGAMGFTIGRYGITTLSNLALLMAAVYITCGLFLFCCLGLVARLCGFSVWAFVKYIKEEFFIVLGTSSSESALPRLMLKLEQAGCARSVVGLVVPAGYSFNLDGTCIYLTMAAVFIGQACDIPLSLENKLALLAVLLLTSKGAAAVTGGGFVTLAATLSTLGDLPVAGLTLLLGVDRFMSEARALTNLIGNGIATIVVAKWENALDEKKLTRALRGKET